MNFSCFIIGEETLTVRCADILLKRGHEINGLISQNQKIRRWANEHNIRLIAADSDLQATLGKSSFDYLFSIANLRLLPKKARGIAAKGGDQFPRWTAASLCRDSLDFLGINESRIKTRS